MCIVCGEKERGGIACLANLKEFQWGMSLPKMNVTLVSFSPHTIHMYFSIVFIQNRRGVFILQTQISTEIFIIISL
jgi:hypothetical protein